MVKLQKWKPKYKQKWTLKKVLFLILLSFLLFMSVLTAILMPLEFIFNIYISSIQSLKFAPLIELFIQLILLILYIVCLIKLGIFLYRKIKHAGLPNDKKIKRYINNQITFFLDEHKMLETDLETGLYNGNLKIEYTYYQHEIHLKFYKNGGKYTDKVADVDSALESLFSMKIKNKEDNINFVYYIFEIEQENKLSKIIFEERYSAEPIAITDKIDWDFRKNPHALIAGVTGGGKSSFLNYILFELMRRKANIYIIDIKNSDLTKLAKRLELSNANEVEKILELTNLVVEKMEERYKIISNDFDNMESDFTTYNWEPIFLIADEIGSLGTGYSKLEKEQIKKINFNIGIIAKKGRQAGVNLIVSTQQMNSNNISTETRDQLGLRVLLGNGKSENIKMVFGEIENKLDILPNEPGNGYIVYGNKEPEKFSAPYIPINRIIEELENLKVIL